MNFKILILLVLCFASTSYSQQNVDVFLIARNTGEKILANNDTIRTFGFANSLGVHPTVPGPTIIANEGDSVHIDLWNVSQGAPHTIHLHGLDVDQQNDGVPHLSFSIEHMDHGYYHFKAPHAGTYLYHCHVASTIHVQAGMYGLIIIKPSDGSNTTWNGGHPYTNEHSYFLSEIDTLWHTDSVLMHDHDPNLTIHTVEIPKYDPQFFLVNGLSDHQLIDSTVEFVSAVNQMDYIRLANIGYYGTRVILPTGLNARIVASDGRPLPTEEISDTVVLYPGERFGVLTEPDMEFQSQIIYEYFDLNTMTVRGTQVVPVIVSGFANTTTLSTAPDAVKVYPNPFNAFTTVEFELEEASKTRVRMFDIHGKLIDEIPFKLYEKGTNTLTIGDKLTHKGTYIIQVTIQGKGDTFQRIIKM
ncbi:Por secretion system C-terminal sorting domain-containing protein [Lishizhenia tianjinensis]|uniref:Por secretion system C-terminal sorting domain-containing protein n=1 Tax=Lishizhenia tianjinensis TaxID=477690 RepID=A0A1I7AIB7_9FLAO|nr:multicopper oxidase domain-containing protein [Lishizhenia tianjinensis]SFT74699.1 Por secretion system C-terminal sorting domain-containing protein [Lishizhenia tianjinensis]